MAKMSEFLKQIRAKMEEIAVWNALINFLGEYTAGEKELFEPSVGRISRDTVQKVINTIGSGHLENLKKQIEDTGNTEVEVKGGGQAKAKAKPAAKASSGGGKKKEAEGDGDSGEGAAAPKKRARPTLRLRGSR